MKQIYRINHKLPLGSKMTSQTLLSVSPVQESLPTSTVGTNHQLAGTERGGQTDILLTLSRYVFDSL